MRDCGIGRRAHEKSFAEQELAFRDEDANSVLCERLPLPPNSEPDLITHDVQNVRFLTEIGQRFAGLKYTRVLSITVMRPRSDWPLDDVGSILGANGNVSLS